MLEPALRLAMPPALAYVLSHSQQPKIGPPGPRPDPLRDQKLPDDSRTSKFENSISVSLPSLLLAFAALGGVSTTR